MPDERPPSQLPHQAFLTGATMTCIALLVDRAILLLGREVIPWTPWLAWAASVTMLAHYVIRYILLVWRKHGDRSLQDWFLSAIIFAAGLAAIRLIEIPRQWLMAVGILLVLSALKDVQRSRYARSPRRSPYLDAAVEEATIGLALFIFAITDDDRIIMAGVSLALVNAIVMLLMRARRFSSENSSQGSGGTE